MMRAAVDANVRRFSLPVGAAQSKRDEKLGDAGLADLIEQYDALAEVMIIAHLSKCVQKTDG
jgi:hypothetical protein